MGYLYKLFLVIATFLLYRFLLWDETLHGGFRFFPVMATIWLVPTFFAGWRIILRNKKINILDIAILASGVFVLWYLLSMAAISYQEKFLTTFVFSFIAIITYGFLFILDTEWLDSVILRWFPRGFLISAIITVLMFVQGDASMYFLIFLPLVLAGAFFVGFVLPALVVTFPLYVLMFTKSQHEWFSWKGSVVILFPFIIFFSSDYGQDKTYSYFDPCYTIIDGKAPSFFIKDDKVCVSDRSPSLTSSSYKTLKGVNPEEYKEKEKKEQEERDIRSNGPGKSVTNVRLEPTPKKSISHTTPIQQEVFFTMQAPHNKWNIKLFQDACEEASMLMASEWILDAHSLTPENVIEKISIMAEYEIKTYGSATDLSIADTALMLRDYWNVNNVSLIRDASKDAIIDVLYDNAIVIAPTNGKALHNPFFTAGGPDEHMLVIIGYDPQTKEFITNDPGTSRGEKYRYQEDVLYDAIRDYPTGDHKPIEGVQKDVAVVRK